MQQLQRGEQQQGLVVDEIAGTGVDSAITPVGERRAKSLAAAQDEVLEDPDKAVVVAADVGGLDAPTRQITVELGSDGFG